MPTLSIGKILCLLFSFYEMKMRRLLQMIDGVKSDNRDLQLSETLKIQILLGQPDPPINEIVEAGVVPCFVQFFSSDDFPELKYAAASVLAKMTSGTSENIEVLIDSGAVPLLVQLLSSDREEHRLLAVSALGNVAADSLHCRDHVLSCGVMTSLLAQINDHPTSEMLISGSRTLLNLCRRLPRPPEADQALPVVKVLLNSNNDLVLRNASQVLFYLTYGNILDVLDVIPRLVQLLSHPSTSILNTILTCIKNTARKNEMNVKKLIDNQALPILLTLLINTDSAFVKKQICLIITHIASVNVSTVQEVIEAGFMQPMIHLLNDSDIEIKEYAVQVIWEVTIKGRHDQIKWLVSQGCIEPLCDLLTCGDRRVISATLDALEKILEAGKNEKNLGNTRDYNLYAKMIIDVGGKTKIYDLRHDDEIHIDIQEKADNLIKWYREDW